MSIDQQRVYSRKTLVIPDPVHSRLAEPENYRQLPAGTVNTDIHQRFGGFANCDAGVTVRGLLADAASPAPLYRPSSQAGFPLRELDARYPAPSISRPV